VSMHVYRGDYAATGDKPDFSGMMGGYTQFFSTKDQPNKPHPSRRRWFCPAGDRCALIEIDLIETLQEE
jgi:hypothetical protein